MYDDGDGDGGGVDGECVDGDMGTDVAIGDGVDTYVDADVAGDVDVDTGGGW